MRRNQRRRPNPTVATHFPSLSSGFDVNLNVDMFTQDVQLGVMPIGGMTEKHKDFTVALEGKQSDCEIAERLIAEIASKDRNDLVGMVCDAVKRMLWDLASSGYAVFEVLRDDEGLEHIYRFPPKCLLKLPRYFLQIIPRGDWEKWEKKFVIVPADRIWYLEMPSELGGRRGYRKILRILEKFDTLHPPFWQQDLQRQVQYKHFDFQWYVRNTQIYRRTVTKSWGWNNCDNTIERTTDFYIYYKLITYCWAKTILREHVINEFNRFFVRLGFECEIKVSGLPTPNEILNVRAKLLAGKISYSEVLDWAWL